MRFRYQAGDTISEIVLERQGSEYRALIDGQTYPVELLDLQPGQITFLFNGRPKTLHWAAQSGKRWVALEGCVYELAKPAPKTAGKRADSSTEDVIRAPMPAQIQSIQVGEGEKVQKGQTLMIVEAMKMEIRVQAPRAGKLRRLLVGVGQTVDRNEILAEIQAEE